MITNLKNIAKNFLSIFVGQGVNLIIYTITFAIIARHLTVESFGNFTLLIATIGIISKFIDFGMSPIVYREKSKSDSNNYLLNTALTLRIIFLIILFFVQNIFFFIMDYGSNDVFIFNILFLSIIFSSKLANIRDLLTVPFKIDLKMHIPSLLNLMDALLFLTLVSFIYYFKSSLNTLIFAYVFSNLPGFLILLSLVRKRYNLRIRTSLNNYKWLIKESLPLSGFVILMIIFQQVDLIIIRFLEDSYSAGIFAISLRLFLPFNLLPAALVTSIFPVIIKNRLDRDALIQGVYKILIIISLTVSIIFTFKSSEIISLIFSNKYEPASVATTILFWSLGILFFNFFTHSIFTIEGKQKLNFLYVLILVSINILFDFLLIPKYSFVGASISKLIASVAGFMFIISKIKKVNVSLNFVNVKFFVFISMSIIGGYLFDSLGLIFYIIALVLLIIILTFITKYFTNNEIKYLFDVLFSRYSKATIK